MKLSNLLFCICIGTLFYAISITAQYQDIESEGEKRESEGEKRPWKIEGLRPESAEIANKEISQFGFEINNLNKKYKSWNEGARDTDQWNDLVREAKMIVNDIDQYELNTWPFLTNNHKNQLKFYRSHLDNKFRIYSN